MSERRNLSGVQQDKFQQRYERMLKERAEKRDKRLLEIDSFGFEKPPPKKRYHRYLRRM